MSTSPTLHLDGDNSLPDHPPIDDSHRNSFGSFEISNEQIQAIFDQPTLLTNSTGMDQWGGDGAGEAKDHAEAVLDAIERPSSPVGCRCG
jgi:hypothetical protein